MHPTRSSLGLLALVVCIPALAKEPADTQTGTPFVTCRAWAIMDGKTGDVVKGLYADEPQKAASTTKIMCAYVILQLAEKDPKVMDEIVTFSKFAADTKGSTSEIKEGEHLPIAECLYGLTNTNRLLGTEGYDGVKTGSTTAAGSCLVVSCHRGEDHLFCVVLGSTSDAGRYADTQNLMRWAWLSRGHRPADQ